MFDVTTEDIYWIEQGEVEKGKEAQGLYSFLPNRSSVKDLAWGSSVYSSSVKSYVELACVQELSKEATGVTLNGCAALWVCGLRVMGVQSWLERIPRCLRLMGTDPNCVGLDRLEALRTDTCSSVVVVLRQSYFLVSLCPNRVGFKWKVVFLMDRQSESWRQDLLVIVSVSFYL